MEEAIAAEKAGADYIGVCAVFGISTKKDARNLSMEKLQEIAVYEDAFYAVKTAKSAGYYVMGVYDDSAKKHWEEISRIADEVIYDWQSS